MTTSMYTSTNNMQHKCMRVPVNAPSSLEASGTACLWVGRLSELARATLDG